jgi:hypothetical protein
VARGRSSGEMPDLAEGPWMRRTVALLLTCAGLAGGLALTAAPGHAQNDPASRALRYLQSQQQVDGSIPAGFPSYSPTEDTVIAAAAAGYDPSAFSHGGASLVGYLQANAAAASSEPGRAGKLVQAIVAADRDPRAFGGVDAVAAITGGYVAATGTYGDGETFTQALAMLGLRSAGVTVPAAAVSRLASGQGGDGGWAYTGTANDPAGSDTNSTAMAVMALDASGDHAADTAALRFLRSAQATGGGFAYAAGSPADADSTALVIQAIVATGGDPAGCAWARSGATPLLALEAMQDSGGGFAGYFGVDAFTTSQVPIALLLQAFPATGTFAAAFTIGDEQQAATAALLYLRSRQSTTDGSVTTSFPSFSPTEDYVIAAAAAGYDPATLRNGTGPSAVDNLAANAGAASSSAAGAGKLIQAVVAARRDPRAFGGHDLVAALEGTYHTDSGLYGDGETYTQSLAMLGVEAAGAPVPAAATAALRAAQDADGGWNYLGKANDPAGSDTNSTAMAIMALDAAGVHGADAAALAWLHTQQQPDGGFAFQGSPSDPDSDALVLQALVALHQDPASSRWTQGGHTVISVLVTGQDPSGGYAGYGGVDAFTTSQVPAGLERVAFPVSFTGAGSWAPGTSLDGAAPGPVVPGHEAPLTDCGATPAPTAVPPTASAGGLGAPLTTTRPAPRHHADDAGTAATTSPAVTPTASPSAVSSTPASRPRVTPAGGVLGTSTGPPSPGPANGSWPLLLIAGALGFATVLGGGLTVARLRR